jgi:hypothetical protein
VPGACDALFVLGGAAFVPELIVATAIMLLATGMGAVGVRRATRALPALAGRRAG